MYCTSAHRQRTLDYISELETEVFRLRESEALLTSKVRDDEGKVEHITRRDTETRVEEKGAITLHVLIQCLNGQIAPGLWITEDKLSDIQSRIPPPHPSPFELSEDDFLSDRSCRLLFFWSLFVYV